MHIDDRDQILNMTVFTYISSYVCVLVLVELRKFGQGVQETEKTFPKMIM